MQDEERVAVSWRRPDREELSAFTDELRSASASVPNGYTFLIHSLAYRELFAFPRKELFDLVSKLILRRKVYSAGIFAGAFRGRSFKLSLDLAEHLYRLGYWKNVLKLNEHESQAFLYGRNVQISSEKNTFTGRLIVLSESGDVLGLGVLDQSGTQVVNLMDKGWYLRRGG
ncbi:MAG: hypothetical protein QW767_02040 [Thermoprotei archaeon]